jgi:hypothetical protein
MDFECSGSPPDVKMFSEGELLRTLVVGGLIAAGAVATVSAVNSTIKYGSPLAEASMVLSTFFPHNRAACLEVTDPRGRRATVSFRAAPPNPLPAASR